MVTKEVKNTILKYGLIQKGDHVIAGLSGGPDSVCLFFILMELKEELGFNMQAVHVNHMLRPGDAEKDQEYVEKLCSESGIMCTVRVYDCVKAAKDRGITTEEAGRDLRYEAFYEAANELAALGIPPEKIKIAVAQNKNDQAETLLMRIIRGTGVNGLSGIEHKRMGESGTTVIRPLLDIDRAMIEKYCSQKGVAPRLDHSNEQPIYTRNKVRLELIPFIAGSFNENIIDALARLSQSAKEDNRYLWKQARSLYDSLKKGPHKPGCIILNRDGLKDSDPAIRHRVIILAFQAIGLAQDIQAPHLKIIDHVLLSGSASAEVNMPGNYLLSVSYNDVTMCLKCEKNTERRENLKLKIRTLTIEEYRSIEELLRQHLSAALDYGRLKKAYENVIESIELRTRRQGDYFTPKGMKKGKKKIQDYFVDRKIPRKDRDYYMFAVIGQEVLWMFSLNDDKHNEINEKYKLTGETYEALILEAEKQL